MTVKTYSIDAYWRMDSDPKMNEDINGDYVLHSDYLTLERERDELLGVLNLSQDEYVKQVGTWKIIRRLEEERDELRTALSLIAEVIPEYASEAWMVQTAKDALGVTP